MRMIFVECFLDSSAIQCEFFAAMVSAAYITQERECLPIHHCGVPHQHAVSMVSNAPVVAEVVSRFTTQQAVIKVGNCQVWVGLPTSDFQSHPSIYGPFKMCQTKLALLGMVCVTVRLRQTWLLPGWEPGRKLSFTQWFPFPTWTLKHGSTVEECRVTGFSGEELAFSISCDSFCSDEPQVYRLIFSLTSVIEGIQIAQGTTLTSAVLRMHGYWTWFPGYRWRFNKVLDLSIHLAPVQMGWRHQNKNQCLTSLLYAFYQSDWFPYIWYLSFSSRTKR